MTGRTRARRDTVARPDASDKPAPIATVEPTDRDPDLVLAGLHLRLGSLALARVELEALSTAGRLDRDALVDLAEVLWRTGDLAAAAGAANTAIEAGDGSATAFAVAAESMAELGRPSEARRLAGRALERVPDAADVVFAGMPRSSVWPPDPSEPPAPAATLFHPEPTGVAIRTTVVLGRAEFSTGPDRGSGHGPGLWDDHDDGTGGSTLPDPMDELTAGQAALAAGDLGRAAIRLGLAIRLSPVLAPAVLDAIAPGSSSALDLVRGDAYRLVGHEREAMESYASAAASAAPETRISAVRPTSADVPG